MLSKSLLLTTAATVSATAPLLHSEDQTRLRYMFDSFQREHSLAHSLTHSLHYSPEQRFENFVNNLKLADERNALERKNNVSVTHSLTHSLSHLCITILFVAIVIHATLIPLVTLIPSLTHSLTHSLFNSRVPLCTASPSSWISRRRSSAATTWARATPPLLHWNRSSCAVASSERSAPCPSPPLPRQWTGLEYLPPL